jgi:hypothetical protein
MNLSPALLRLSQSHLTLLETCPPQFQKVFLEQGGAIPNPAQQDGLAWGNQFHLLMQQKILGLPIDAIADPTLQQSLQALIEATPELWQENPLLWKEAEHYRTMVVQNYQFSVIYDLLVIDERRSQILDWKTYPMPQNTHKIASSWQTRLYLYVLAESSDFRPEQLSMTYWFVQLPKRPQSLTIDYSQAQHDQTRQDLARLLSQLESGLKNYQQNAIAFPHSTNCAETCPYYSRLVLSGDSLNHGIDWQNFLEETQEIPLNRP